MRPRRRTVVLTMLSTCLAPGLGVAMSGCSLNKSEPRRDVGPLGRLGTAGQVIQPRRLTLRVVIVPRTLNDPLINEKTWGLADEQVLPPQVRRDLEANGLRIGLLTGGLPAEVEAAMQEPLPKKVVPAEFDLPDGDHTVVSLSEAVPTATVLLNHDGRATAKDLKDASGYYRVTATQDGPTGVSLRLAPEIHHGAVLRRFDGMGNATANGGGMLNPMQFVVKDGQQEETLRDVAATLTLQPGQVLVVGCDPAQKGTLGSFLFTQPEANSDRITQKVLFVTAVRGSLGPPGSQPKTPAGLVPVEPPDVGASPKDKDREREKG